MLERNYQQLDHPLILISPYIFLIPKSHEVYSMSWTPHNWPLTNNTSSIIIVHNMNNTQRITVSFPKYLYEDLVQLVPSGQVSSFVAQAVEKELIEAEGDPFEEFMKLRKKFPKKRREEIMKAIKKGRI